MQLASKQSSSAYIYLQHIAMQIINQSDKA